MKLFISVHFVGILKEDLLLFNHNGDRIKAHWHGVYACFIPKVEKKNYATQSGV